MTPEDAKDLRMIRRHRANNRAYVRAYKRALSAGLPLTEAQRLGRVAAAAARAEYDATHQEAAA
jgi:hypothetical protein